LYVLITVIYILILKIIKQSIKKNKKNKFKLLSIKRYFRYIKLVVKLKIVLVIIFFSIISNLITIIQNDKYESLYQENEKIQILGIIESNKQEKEYYNRYKLKVIKANNQESYKNTYVYIRLDKKSSYEFVYGDVVILEGEFLETARKTNYGGFDYKQYLKTLKIYGEIRADKVNIVDNNKGNLIIKVSNDIRFSLKEKVNKIIKTENVGIMEGLLIGDTSNINEELKEDFQVLNISHILAVSGTHIGYIVIGISGFIGNHLGKRKTKFVIIIILFMYMLVTGFSASIVRATIMGIISISSKLIHRKNDIATTISLSLLLLLIDNPFVITNIGLQLSYLGTIAIVIFNKTIFGILINIGKKEEKFKNRLDRKIDKLVFKIKEIISITLSAQIIIFPVMIYHFNLFGTYFLIANFWTSILSGPLILIGFLNLLLSYIFMPLANTVSIITNLLIDIFISISKISELPYSKIYLRTPKIFEIIIYFIIIFISFYIYSIYHSKLLSNTEKRIKNLIELFKYRLRENQNKAIILVVIIIIIFSLIVLIPKNLKIYFVDVSQGDCTFIVTPKNNTILIDGGGSLQSNFDVGKSVLIPYLLDRGYTKIDYIFISHFDQDHVGGILTVLEELKVGNIIIGEQGENSRNYEEFLRIIKEKKIKVEVVKSGDIIKIENGIQFDILWPNEELIRENILNNNSVVMKMKYNNFSMLFTGDIEEIAEKKIVNKYLDTNILESTILKVAHHGSKSSSIEEILNLVKPKITVIGVGKNNGTQQLSKTGKMYLVNRFRTPELRGGGKIRKIWLQNI